MPTAPPAAPFRNEATGAVGSVSLGGQLMTRSLGTASSNPQPMTPEYVALRDGEAAPNDWLTIFLTLADRLVDWEEACKAEEATLVFDSHDQAKLA